MSFLEPVFFIAYLMGAIPTSYIIAKLFFKKNLLNEGSKNLGATNAFRVLGKRAGLTVLVLDILKGFIPIILAKFYFKLSLELISFTGLIAILGHSFSIFVKFKGGKGVATATGVFLALAPKALLSSLSVFFITFFSFKFVSLGSILAAFSLPFFVYLFEDLLILPISIIISFFIIFKHKANITRLIKGEESRFLWKKTKI